LNSAKTTLSKSGTPNQATLDLLAASEKDIEKIQAYCLKTEGKIDQAYIDGEISYARKNIIALTANVKKLQSDLSAKSCPGVTCESGYSVNPDDCGCTCKLDCARGNVYNWGKCICSPYADIDTAYDLRTNVTELVRRITETFTDSTKVNEYLEKIYSFQNNLNTLVGDVEYNFETQTLTETTKKIQELVKEFQKIETEFNDYKSSSQVCSSTQCAYPTLLVKGCTCNEGPEISKYYELRDAFISVEEKVKTYTGTGVGNPEHKALIDEAAAIRKLIEQYQTYLINNPGAYNSAEVAKMTDEIKKRTDALNKDFDAWNEKQNPTVTCKVKCTANNEVFDERNCKCVIINDYELLPGTLEKLKGLRDRISKLTIDDKNRGTFNDNV
jgi:hypothetical protein